MIGERLYRVHEDHQQAEGQHNRQWMDKLIRHTSSEAGSGGSGYGQHPHNGVLVYTGVTGGHGCLQISDERDAATKEMRTVLITTDTSVQKRLQTLLARVVGDTLASSPDMKEYFIGKDKDRSKYAWLSKMTIYSKGSKSIGALLASSFCERVNLFANQVVTFGNTLLGDGEMET